MKQFFIWNNINQIIHSKTTTSQKFGGSKLNKINQIQSQKTVKTITVFNSHH